MRGPILVALAAFGAAAPALAQTPDTPPAGRITTSGRGEAILSPDRAVLRIGAESRAATAAAASAQNATRIARIVDALAALGYRRDSIRTVGYSVGPNYDYSEGRKLVDYMATSTLQVSSRDLPKLGALIDRVLAAGATDVPGIEFTSDSAPAGRRRALAAAFARARADAEAIAAAAGGRLGPLVSVSTVFEYPRPMPMGMQTSMANATAPPDVRRDVILDAELTAAWTIEGGVR